MGAEAGGRGRRGSPLDFYTWYRSVFFRYPPSGRGLTMLFISFFCYFSVFFPLAHALEIFLPTPLPKDTTNELAGLSPHYLFFMLNVKQGSAVNTNF